MDEFLFIYEHYFFTTCLLRRKKREEPQRGGRKRQQEREEGKKIKKWDGRKAERKTEEPADWKENLEPEGDRTNRTHGRLRRKSAPRRYDALDEAREMETTCAARAAIKC